MLPFATRSRQHRGRHRAQFDTLEGRIALTMDGVPSDAGILAPAGYPTADVGIQSQDVPLSVDLATPIPGSVLLASPTSLVLEFNRPILPDSLASDVEIVQTDTDGNLTWIMVPDQLTLDDTGTRLTVVLPQTLAPGDYQVRVSGFTGISDINGNPLIPDGNDLILGQFKVAVPGVRLKDAVALGELGPTPMEVSGELNFQTGGHGVSLYRIQLNPGHYWRLGLEVTAQRDGGTLDSALSLFDEQGTVIATDDVGRTDDPKDPFLFAGLQEGTYFVGVSGVGNLAGTASGYDPATGWPGTVGQSQDGGPFTLHLVADTVDAPPSLSSFSLDHADPIDPSPTGLTLGFSRAIALSDQPGNLEPSLSKSIEVLDQKGKKWPVQASTFSEAEAKISYLFDGFLPPGHYTVKLPEQGGLKDLAGLSPVADGQADGVLGQFDVPEIDAARDPLDLGALLPKAASDGVSLDVSLSEGFVASYRVVVTVPGQYKFQVQSSGDSPSIQLVGPGWVRSLDLVGSNDTLLSPGVYSIVFQAPKTDPLEVHSFLRLASTDIEIVLANGVGQGPALSLRLISFPALSALPPPPPPPPTIPPPPPPTSPPPVPTVVDINPSPAPLPAPLPHGESGPPPADSAASTRLASGPSIAGVTSTAPAGAVSFLGPASDLVGRPVSEAVQSGSSAMGFSLRGDSQAFGGIVRGQSLTLLMSQPARFASPNSDTVTADVLPTNRVQAGMIELDIGGAIEFVVGLQQWAIGWGESVVEWAEPWTKERPGFGYPVTRIAQVTRGLNPDQPNIDSGAASAAIHDESSDSSSSRPWFLAPPVVVISVAAIAQVCWHYARSRKSRRGAETGEVLKDTATELLSDKRVSIDPILFRNRGRLISRQFFRKSHAS